VGKKKLKAASSNQLHIYGLIILTGDRGPPIKKDSLEKKILMADRRNFWRRGNINAQLATYNKHG
jgi:hypothetical protein